jgi:hypothetical protein
VPPAAVVAKCRTSLVFRETNQSYAQLSDSGKDWNTSAATTATGSEDATHPQQQKQR